MLGSRFYMFLWIFLDSMALTQSPVQSFDLEEDMKNYPELVHLYGTNKILCENEEFNAGFLRALSFYPELEATPMSLMLVDEPGIVHKCVPSLSVLNPFSDTRYLVKVSTTSREINKNTLHENLSYNARIGVLSHEAGHANVYNKFSTAQFLKFGMEYGLGHVLYGRTQNPELDLRVEYELEADLEAILAGAGIQLLQWKKETYAIYAADKRGHLYMDADDVRNNMLQMPMYDGFELS